MWWLVVMAAEVETAEEKPVEKEPAVLAAEGEIVGLAAG